MQVFIRNDDVNTLDPELQEFTETVLQAGACIDMAVEPANVKDDTVAWVCDLKDENPDRISIITHGYDHKDRIAGKGEFGGRSYADQYPDIVAGRKIMADGFGLRFFPAFTCPRGGHNRATIRCLNDTDYKVFSSYHNVYLKNRILNALGRTLRRNHVLGKRVSYHTLRVPGTRLLDVSMSMSFIAAYHSDEECTFATLDHLKRRFLKIRTTGQRILGITAHHRFHRVPQDMQLVRDTVDFLNSEGCRFVTLETIYEELRDQC